MYQKSASEVTTWWHYTNLFIITIFYPGLKTKKAKIKMSDGHRSGRSTGRVSCKSTELKRCSMIETRWNKYEVSLTSHVVINIRAERQYNFLVVFYNHPMCRLRGLGLRGLKSESGTMVELQAIEFT